VIGHENSPLHNKASFQIDLQATRAAVQNRLR
jgi:hypothetical protein